MFSELRMAFKLAGTVVELNERLTALEGNFDILDRSVKRQNAQERAANSRARAKLEISGATEQGPTESGFVTPPPFKGGIMRRQRDGS